MYIIGAKMDTTEWNDENSRRIRKKTNHQAFDSLITAKEANKREIHRREVRPRSLSNVDKAIGFVAFQLESRDSDFRRSCSTEDTATLIAGVNWNSVDPVATQRILKRSQETFCLSKDSPHTYCLSCNPYIHLFTVFEHVRWPTYGVHSPWRAILSPRRAKVTLSRQSRNPMISIGPAYILFTLSIKPCTNQTAAEIV